MKRKLLLICLLVFGVLSAQAQRKPKGKDNKAFRTYTEDGETYGEVILDAVDITAKRPSARQLKKGKRVLRRYTKLRWNVHKVYPYAVKASQILLETNRELAALPPGTKRKKFIKEKEKSLFGKYEKDIRNMTRSQGKILVKLIDRETGTTTYSLIKDFKSGASAVFWQSIGLIFGISLKSEYNSDKEDDAMIEAIVQDLESGGYNIVYRKRAFQLQ